MKTDVYHFRASQLKKPWVVEAGPDAICIREEVSEKTIREIQYQDVRYVREMHYGSGGNELEENPFPIQMLKIVPHQGKPIVVKSACYRGLGSKRACHYEDQLETFQEFKSAWKTRMLHNNPAVYVVDGSLVISILSFLMTIATVICGILLQVMVVYCAIQGDVGFLDLLEFWAMGTVTLCVGGIICYAMYQVYWPSRKTLAEHLRDENESAKSREPEIGDSVKLSTEPSISHCG